MWSAVERLVAGQDAVDEIAVAIDEPLDGEPDLLLGQPAHLEQARLELLELLLKVPDDAVPRGSINRTSR